MRMLGIALLLVSGVVNALTITIEPDDYELGTNLTQAVTGVQLSTLSGEDIFATLPQVSDPMAQAPTGDLVFGRGLETGQSNWYLIPSAAGNIVGNINAEVPPVVWPDHALLIKFDELTNYVSFQGGGASSGPALFAYDVNGDFISEGLSTLTYDRYFGPTNPGGGAENFWTFEVTSASRNIGYVMIGGGDNNARIDHITYSVPEPSTLALFGFGIAGLLVRRRSAFRVDR